MLEYAQAMPPSGLSFRNARASLINRGDVRVHVHCRTERSSQRPEPRLVVAPMGERAGVDGRAHLFGTDCADGARVLVELKARLLERQLQIAEQPADLALRIGD